MDFLAHRVKKRRKNLNDTSFRTIGTTVKSHLDYKEHQDQDTEKKGRSTCDLG